MQLAREPAHPVAVLDRASRQPVGIGAAVPIHANVGERGRGKAVLDERGCSRRARDALGIGEMASSHPESVLEESDRVVQLVDDNGVIRSVEKRVRVGM